MPFSQYLQIPFVLVDITEKYHITYTCKTILGYKFKEISFNTKEKVISPEELKAMYQKAHELGVDFKEDGLKSSGQSTCKYS